MTQSDFDDDLWGGVIKYKWKPKFRILVAGQGLMGGFAAHNRPWGPKLVSVLFPLEESEKTYSFVKKKKIGESSTANRSSFVIQFQTGEPNVWFARWFVAGLNKVEPSRPQVT
ncbi:hypothetical protein ACLOJK_005354 [Asimina triloba]